MKDETLSGPATQGDLTKLEKVLKGDLTKLEKLLKGDLTKLEKVLKVDLTKLEKVLKGDLTKLEKLLKGDLTKLEKVLKGDLINGLAELKTEFKSEISTLTETVIRLAVDGAKTQADVRQIKDDMATKMSTKNDINRILNAIDKFTGMTENYKRKDLERGQMLMKQEDKLQNHESRLVLLETPK